MSYVLDLVKWSYIEKESVWGSIRLDHLLAPTYGQNTIVIDQFSHYRWINILDQQIYTRIVFP